MADHPVLTELRDDQPVVSFLYVKDRLQFVCGELHSALTSRSAMLRQSFASGNIKEKHLRKMFASSYACRRSKA
jgi:hypothetical protein